MNLSVCFKHFVILWLKWWWNKPVNGDLWLLTDLWWMLIRPVASSKHVAGRSTHNISCLIHLLECLWTACVSAMMSCVVSNEESSWHVWIQPLHLKTLVTFFFKTTNGTSKSKTRDKRLLFIRQVKMSSYLLTSSSCSSWAAICSVGCMSTNGRLG